MHSANGIKVACRMILTAGACLAGGMNLQAQEKGVMMVEMGISRDLAARIQQNRAAGGSEEVTVLVETSTGSRSDPLSPDFVEGTINNLDSNPRMAFGPFSVRHEERRPFTAPADGAMLVSATHVALFNSTGTRVWFKSDLIHQRLSASRFAGFQKSVEETGILLTSRFLPVSPDPVFKLLAFQPLGVSQEDFETFRAGQAETKGAPGAPETKSPSQRDRCHGMCSTGQGKP